MTLIVPSRRRFLAGALGLIAAPALARAEALMPVKVVPPLAPLWRVHVVGVDHLGKPIHETFEMRFKAADAVTNRLVRRWLLEGVGVAAEPASPEAGAHMFHWPPMPPIAQPKMEEMVGEWQRLPDEWTRRKDGTMVGRAPAHSRELAMAGARPVRLD